jgi:hypothetical protein
MGASTAIISAGLISLTTSNLIYALLGFVPGVLAVVATALGARAVVTDGTPLVTPVADPRDDQGRKLSPTPLAPPPAPPI